MNFTQTRTDDDSALVATTMVASVAFWAMLFFVYGYFF
jgi:hypothetical protein